MRSSHTHQPGERASARVAKTVLATSGTASRATSAQPVSSPAWRVGPSRLMRRANGSVQTSSRAWTTRATALATKALSLSVGPRMPRLKAIPSR